jgi:hypothetical protein
MTEKLPKSPETKTSDYRYFNGPRDQASIDFLADKEIRRNDFEVNNLSLKILLERNKKLQEANRIKNNIDRRNEKIINIFLTVEAGALSSILALFIWLGAGYRYESNKPNELNKVLGFGGLVRIISAQILINSKKKD